MSLLMHLQLHIVHIAPPLSVSLVTTWREGRVLTSLGFPWEGAPYKPRQAPAHREALSYAGRRGLLPRQTSGLSESLQISP